MVMHPWPVKTVNVRPQVLLGKEEASQRSWSLVKKYSHLFLLRTPSFLHLLLHLGYKFIVAYTRGNVAAHSGLQSVAPGCVGDAGERKKQPLCPTLSRALLNWKRKANKSGTHSRSSRAVGFLVLVYAPDNLLLRGAPLAFTPMGARAPSSARDLYVSTKFPSCKAFIDSSATDTVTSRTLKRNDAILWRSLASPTTYSPPAADVSEASGSDSSLFNACAISSINAALFVNNRSAPPAPALPCRSGPIPLAKGSFGTGDSVPFADAEALRIRGRPSM
ncbi:hypothetical protein TGRUB_252295 [Toxoplasma gondii RUB]|uniref:Uncharacterized protein n=1 Tax=Toxoplasma gondii RUB TaxID=935652 RepID=A0A086LMS3_TOXGO|nr:hypothetical protein TGRUB_252295 [Toxoplasma gondii RUB]